MIPPHPFSNKNIFLIITRRSRKGEADIICLSGENHFYCLLTTISVFLLYIFSVCLIYGKWEVFDSLTNKWNLGLVLGHDASKYVPMWC